MNPRAGLPAGRLFKAGSCLKTMWLNEKSHLLLGKVSWKSGSACRRMAIAEYEVKEAEQQSQDLGRTSPLESCAKSICPVSEFSSFVFHSYYKES